MASNLQHEFTSIRTRQEVLAEIHSVPRLSERFYRWSPEQRELFLDYCTGQRGVKILSDAFFKAILNPRSNPERVETLLSLLLDQPVRIQEVLSLESPRIAYDASLVIMDLVVKLRDGSLANLEVQRIGYAFPGQRAACYSADLLLRQYHRIHSQKGRAFSYRDIQRVYTILLFEHSPKEFGQYPEHYRHVFRQRSDTGLEMELLQEYGFFPLDIYRRILHNKSIRNQLEAWLAFLCEDEPEEIEKLLRTYPYFRELYEEIYQLCRNTEEVMEMFSKELRELDQNTVQYMIDEMQEEINRQKDTIGQQSDQLEERDTLIREQNSKLQEQEAALSASQAEIQRLKELLKKRI